MFDYEKIYKKSVYKENFQEYISTWKLAVAKKRLIELLPYIQLGDTIDVYRRRWQLQDKNMYTMFVNSLLRTYDGFEALRLFTSIRYAYLNKRNKEFTEQIECLYLHLRKFPTLVSFFLLTNVGGITVRESVRTADYISAPRPFQLIKKTDYWSAWNALYGALVRINKSTVLTYPLFSRRAVFR